MHLDWQGTEAIKVWSPAPTFVCPVLGFRVCLEAQADFAVLCESGLRFFVCAMASGGSAEANGAVQRASLLSHMLAMREDLPSPSTTVVLVGQPAVRRHFLRERFDLNDVEVTTLPSKSCPSSTFARAIRRAMDSVPYLCRTCRHLSN